MNRLVYNLRSSNWLFPALLVVCVACIFAAAVLGIVVNMLVIGVIIGITVFYLSYTAPKYNGLILLAVFFFIPLCVRAFYLYDAPYGVFSEALIILMIFTLVLNGRISGWKSTAGILLLIWLVWHGIELLNPAAPSRVASFLSVRKVIFTTAAFFIMYSSVESKKDIYLFFKGWFALSLLVALYAFYQEYVGLPPYDDAWVHSDELIFKLLFTWGRLRKFSFFFSPTEFGVLMAYAGVASVIFFILGARKLQHKIILGTLPLIFFWSMMFSGSRTASVLLPVGFLFLGLITMKRNVLIMLGGVAVAGALLMLKPTSNASLYVMLTAFDTEDASMNVRLTNQKIIQSYIQEKPIGFGLGSTGDAGRRYSPGSFISNFPPDSEFVRIAIETGWVGLFLWCSILGILAAYGIDTYFKTKDAVWRKLIVVLVCLLFMMIVAQYPQEMLSSLSLIFALTVGLIAKVRKLVMAGNQPALSDD